MSPSFPCVLQDDVAQLTTSTAHQELASSTDQAISFRPSLAKLHDEASGQQRTLRKLHGGQPAEIGWRDHLSSTHGAVEHLKIRCLDRHWFLMPADMLTR